jgi:hypothetical protein
MSACEYEKCGHWSKMMSNSEYYEAKLEAIRAIKTDDIKQPKHIPVGLYAQEAENLYRWCQEDKDQLVARGLSWDFVADIPARIGALMEAESLWNKRRRSRDESAKQWEEISTAGYELKNNLMHEFRFAFRHNDKLLKAVRYMGNSSGHAGMIQALNDLSVLGKGNLELLGQINFDTAQLDRAAEISSNAGHLLAVAIGRRAACKDSKIIRDQAFTYLKTAVDEIYHFGRLVFWRDNERIQGYRSEYLYRKRIKKLSPQENNIEPLRGNDQDMRGNS